MILIDTSIWIDHIRSPDAIVSQLLADRTVITHAYVIGEIAVGQIRTRIDVLSSLKLLPAARLATTDEVLIFIERHGLFGQGIGYVDAHLLAATKLTRGASLWTRDKRLNEVALRLSIAANPVQ